MRFSDSLAWERCHGQTRHQDPERRTEVGVRLCQQRKEPLEDASHVRNAIARFNQVKDVTDGERDAAWKRIKTAAKKYDVEVDEKSWRELGKS